jgi:hypothetical protein
MKHTSTKPPPMPLQKRGIRRGTEIAPVEGDFEIRDAGKNLADLFGPEILRRLAHLRAKRQPEEAA